MAKAGLKGEFDGAQGAAGASATGKADEATAPKSPKPKKWAGLSTPTHALPELSAAGTGAGGKGGGEPTLQRHVDVASASAADQV